MAEYEQKINIREQASTYLYFSSIYFVTLGILYLWGYWNTFNINILEYLSLADVLKYTAFPIAISVVSVAIGAAIGRYIGKSFAPLGGAKNTRIGHFISNFVNKIAPLPMILYGFGTVLLLLFGPSYKWLLVYFLIAVPIVISLAKSGFLASLTNHDGNRYVIITLLVSLPGLSFNQGLTRATAVLEGKYYFYVTSQIEGINVSDNTPPNQRLRFLGHAGDFLFFLHPAKEVLVIKNFDAATILQLKEFKTCSQISAGTNTAAECNAPKSGIRPPTH